MKHAPAIRLAVSLFSLLGLAAACVSVGAHGGIGGGARPGFGPVETIGAGQAYATTPHPTDVATDGQGRWLLVLSAATGSDDRGDLFLSASNDNGHSWSEPALLHPYFLDDGLRDERPRLVHGRGRTWLVVWNAWSETGSLLGGPSALYSRSTDNGVSWSEPARLNVAPIAPDEQEYEPALATDGRGAWMCAWLSFGYRPGLGPTEECYSYLFATFSTDDAATWSPPVAVYRGTLPQRVSLYAPAVASDGVRAFTTAWTEAYAAPDGTVRHRVLAVSTRDRGRTWSPAAVVHNGFGNDLCLAYGDRQACLALWESGQWIDDAWVSSGIVSSRSTDLGATWSPPTTLLAPRPEEGRSSFPRAATDGRGHWTAVWQTRSTGDRDLDVWSSLSTDNGRTWSAPTPIHSEDPVDQAEDVFPVVAADGRGRWLVQWSRRANVEGHVLLYRLSDLPRAWWRDIHVGVGITGSIPL